MPDLPGFGIWFVQHSNLVLKKHFPGYFELKLLIPVHALGIFCEKSIIPPLLINLVLLWLLLVLILIIIINTLNLIILLKYKQTFCK